MSLGGILILVLLVVSLAIFIYLIVLTARSWNVLHTVMLCILFIECWTFAFLTANVLDRRLAELKDFHETSQKLTKVRADVQKLMYGGDNIAEEQDALIPLSGEVRRLTADRGRVWRNATKINIENQQVRVDLAAKTPEVNADGLTADAPAAAGAGVQDSIPQDMVVYAFAQGLDDPAAAAAPADPNADPTASAATKVSALLPKAYLGEFKVVESTPGQVLLRAITTLEPAQIQAINNESTWTLYEMLPQDSHETFAATGSQASENEMFGRMDEQQLNAAFAEVPEENDRRKKLIASYLHDGQPAVETDPPRDVWLQVEVAKPFELDVDSDEQNNATVGGYFDASGRTVDIRIKRGEEKKVTLAEGQRLLLPQDRANEMIGRGEVKLIQRIYVRPLNAYEKGYGHLKVRRDEVLRLIDVTKRELAVLEEANQLGLTMTSNRQVEREKLEADKQMYEKELAIINVELKAITDKYQSDRAELIKYYRLLEADHNR